MTKIDRNSVHVWRIALDRSEAGNPSARTLLSPEERQRADRFRFDQDRRRWIAARSALRRILGAYLGIAPMSVRFCLGPYGKPFVAEPAADGLEFNLSHSDAYAVIAVTRGGPVGVDLERVRDDIAASDLWAVLTADERAALDGVAPDRKALAFFQCWTRKEALLKALGTGFSGTDHALPSGAYRTYDLTPLPGYVGTLAVFGDVTIVHRSDD